MSYVPDKDAEQEHFEKWKRDLDLGPMSSIKSEQLEESLLPGRAIGFYEIENPFDSELVLQFDYSSVILGLKRWTNDRDEIPIGPTMARITTNINNAIPGAKNGSWVILDGANVDTFMNANSTGVLASDCSITYRRVEHRPVLPQEMSEAEIAHISQNADYLTAVGLLKYDVGHDIYLDVNQVERYTAPLRQVLQILPDNSTQPLFDIR
jgi:hypothetical protein